MTSLDMSDISYNTRVQWQWTSLSRHPVKLNLTARWTIADVTRVDDGRVCAPVVSVRAIVYSSPLLYVHITNHAVLCQSQPCDHYGLLLTRIER